MRRRRFLRAGGAVLAGAVTLPTARAATTTTQSATFEPLGSLEIDGLSEVVVDASGTVAYGALRDGFVVVDISDPASPTELSRVTGILSDAAAGPVKRIYDVKISGDRLLVAGPHVGSGPDRTTGFEVYDVAEPTAPTRLAGTETDHAIHNGFIDRETVYLTGTGAPTSPLVIYDVGGDGPTELARWSVEEADSAWGSVSANFRECHDVYVRDGLAFVAYWDAGTWVLDVSDPTSPAVVGSTGGVPPQTLPASTDSAFPPGARELPGNSHYAQPSPDGTLLAVGKEAWDDDATPTDGGPGGVEVWDITTPSEPRRLSILAPTGEDGASHNFGWRGRRLYTSWQGGSVRVFDLSDPTAPRQLARWAAPDRTAFWTAKPAREGVVASSFLDPQQDREARFEGVGAALYTFPEPGDGGATAAATMTPRPTQTVTPTSTPLPFTSTTAATSETTTSPTTSVSPTSPSDATTIPDTNEPTGRTGGTTTDVVTSLDQPGDGFGLLAALAAGGIATWRLFAADGGGSE